jgi:hypothetical protein
MKIIVSTVGMYSSPLYPAVTEIGHNRYYETMVFKAILEGKYWDADVTKEVNFDSKWAVDHADDNSDNEANDMHENVVTEITTRMEQGEFQ